MTNMTRSSELTVVADIGGTNTRIALASGQRVMTETIARFPNAESANFTQVLDRYLADNSVKPQSICVAVAGPVQNGQATLTNLNWSFDENTLCERTGAQLAVITNDLQAQGYAVGHLDADQLQPLLPHAAEAPTDASGLVIGVGTGFNAAPIHHAHGLTVVPASECGHINLPQRSAPHRELADMLNTEDGFASIEHVLSGRGLTTLYRFVAGADAKALPAQDIMHACAAGDALATETVRLAVQLLGAVAGDLALTHLPFGGIYFVGGVSRALAPYFGPFGFGDAFRDKGRFSDFMKAFPVSLVTDDYAALLGCALLVSQRNQT